jgi:hypothetical protein
VAPITAFLNCSAIGPVSDRKVAWTVRKNLAMKELGGFGVDLSKVVELVETTILNESKLNIQSKGLWNDYSEIKIAIFTEIEASKRNFLFANPESKLDTFSMKQLWSIIAQCFEDFIKFNQLNKEEPNVNDWILLKETLHIFEWIRHQVDKFHGRTNFEEELLMVLSIAWLKLKKYLENSYSETYHVNQGPISLRPREDGTEHNSNAPKYLPIIEISKLLEPQIHQFNLTVRQFWDHVGFLKVSRCKIKNKTPQVG